MKILAVALPSLAIGVVLLLVVEIRRYRTGRHVVSARRFLLRLVAGLLLIGLLAAVFLGLFVFRLAEASERAQLFVVFWGGCVLTAVVLVFVMLADVREVEDRFTQRQHEIWREFARYIAGSMKPSGGREEPSCKDEPKG